MLANLPRCIATWSSVQNLRVPRRAFHRLPLLFVGMALGLSGCHARSAVPASIPVTPARALAGVPSAAVQVQSTPLYQQARQDCKRQDYAHAAQLLETLAKTPGLAPEAVAFVQKQKAICLKDEGLPVASSVLTSLPVRTPADADCGPRALLLVCQKLGVKANLETLRKAAGTTADGTTMEGLQKAAQKLGLKAEGVQVSRDALPDVSPPAIVWVLRNHFVVLTGISGRGDEAKCSVQDPNKPGEEVWLQEKLLQQSSGVLLLLHR